MESFKHSCPFCGQHIEYTVGYCGKQMKCPICANVITFPALPPATTAKGLRVDRPAAAAVRKWAWKPPGIYLFLRDFPHWKIVGQVVIPFVIVGGLLVGAAYVKKTFTDSPVAAPPEASVEAAAPDAWQKMTDLSRADQAMRDQLRVAMALRTTVKRAQTICNNSRAQYGNASPFTAKAQEMLQRAQNNYSIAFARLRSLNGEYQKLGGTADYLGQLSN